MVKVIFYEKPGCINNTKQKVLLKAAGHELEVHNLLTERWTTANLRPFFGSLPVTEWFNYTAPSIKSGKVNPEELDEETALNLMIREPLLIRRPLMSVGNVYQVGFNWEKVNDWIGLSSITTEDLETCPNNQ